MKTGIITTDTYRNHDTGQGHPERADRVTVVIDHLKKIKYKNLIWKKPAKFDLKYLEFAHDKNYLNNVKDSFPKQGLNFLDGDTIVSPGSKEATRDAVGSILTAIDGVMKKDLDISFILLINFYPIFWPLFFGSTYKSSRKFRPFFGKESFMLSK